MKEGMTVDEAIINARQIANECKVGEECVREHGQLTDWLEELVQYRATGLTPDEITKLEAQEGGDGTDVVDRVCFAVGSTVLVMGGILLALIVLAMLARLALEAWVSCSNRFRDILKNRALFLRRKDWG